MTAQQQLALSKHCRLACETAHPRYRVVRHPYSVIVTVNSGWE